MYSKKILLCVDSFNRKKAGPELGSAFEEKQSISTFKKPSAHGRAFLCEARPKHR